MSPLRTLIVGIGSPHGDDQAGWQVAEQLAGKFDRDDIAVRQVASPAKLLDWLEGLDRLVVCDACHGVGCVGEIRRWAWPARELQDISWSGTHDLALPAVLQLAARLGHLPQRVAIWSVEGTPGDALAAISSEVEAALPRLVDGIANEVNQGRLCTNNHS